MFGRNASRFVDTLKHKCSMNAIDSYSISRMIGSDTEMPAITADAIKTYWADCSLYTSNIT